MRRHLATVLMGGSAGLGDNPLALFDHAIGLARVVLVLSVWRAVIDSGDAPAGFTRERVLSYVLLASVLSQQLDARTGISDAIWEGSVTTRLLRPVGVAADYIAEMVGEWGLRWLTFSLPVLALAPVLGLALTPATPARGGLFLFSLVLSVAVGVGVDFLFAVLIVSFHQSMWALRYARDGLTPLLAGAVIPLALMPWGLGDVLAWLPFASMASAPLRIYVGHGDPARLLALQAGWALVLAWLARGAWRRAAPRMVTAGG